MRVRRSRDHKALSGIVFFWILFCAFFLLSDSASIQWDMVDLHHPALHALARAFSEGRLPHWTPHIASGYPLLSDPQVAAFYPPVTVAALLGPPGTKTLAFLVCLHLLIAAWGLYFLSRCLGASVGGACLGALGYGFGGFLIGHASHLGMQGAAAWLPWLLLAWIRSRKGSLRWTLAASLFLALIALAGHFQSVLFCLMALLGTALHEVWRRKHFKGVALRLLGVCLFAGSLATVQILPAAQMGLLSARHHLAYGETTYPRIRLASLANLFFADGFGAVTGKPYVGPWDRTQFYFYPGMTVALLGILGIFLGKKKRRLSYGLPLLATWLYASGGTLQWIVWKVIPGFASIRGPINSTFLAHLLLCLSAALFWRDLRRLRLSSRKVVAAGLGILALSTGFLLHAWDHASPWGAVRSNVLDLTTARSELLFPSLVLGWLLALLVLGTSFWRLEGGGRRVTVFLLLLSVVDLYGNGAYRNHLFHSKENLGKRLETERQSSWLAELRKNRLARFHDLNEKQPLLDWRALIHGVNSTQERSPLRSAAYADYLQAAMKNQRLFDQLGVLHFIVPSETGKEVRRSRGRPLFPFTLAGRLRFVENDEEERRALLDLHPPQEAIVRNSDEFPRDLQTSHLSILGLDFDRKGARLRFHAAQRGLLVFASPWHPNWQARLDGALVPIHRVDHALMGVLVPAGKHRIEWVFTHRLFSFAATVSLLSLAIFCAVFLRGCLPVRAYMYT